LLGHHEGSPANHGPFPHVGWLAAEKGRNFDPSSQNQAKKKNKKKKGDINGIKE